MNVAEIDAISARDAGASTAHHQFPQRWSPRAMNGDPLTGMEIETLLEAARWAPSCFNAQPWRFAWTTPASDRWDDWLGVLVDANRLWAQHAGALFAVASRTHYEANGDPAPTHAFDAGAAWMSIALQAQHMGLVAHGMAGFDLSRATTSLALPATLQLNAIIAVGRPGDVESLPEKYQARETPSPRKVLAEIAFAGQFPAEA